MLSQSLWGRLRHQLDAAATILAGAPESLIGMSGPDGAWSARDHLAHLARMHEVFLERLRRILREDAPRLGQYRAEQDPEWTEWQAFSTREVLTKLQALRSELLGVVGSLSPAQLEKSAVHPELGRLEVPGWLEAFCLHEGHHLHAAWDRLGAATRAESRGSTSRA